MADFISDIAAKAGIDSTMAKKGLGALLAGLQNNIPADVFSKLSSVIPNATGILSSFQSSGETGQSGSTAGLAGLVGSLMGQSGALGDLVSQFSKAGFSMDAAKAFVPAVLQVLGDKLPAETLKQIQDALPGLSNILGGEESGGILGKVKNLF